LETASLNPKDKNLSFPLFALRRRANARTRAKAIVEFSRELLRMDRLG